MRLAEQSILLTGAARGIGRAAALEFARAGAARIIGVDLDADGLQQTAGLVSEAGAGFASLPCDLLDAQAVQRMLDTATRLGFRILVNNAGVLPSGPFLERDFQTWQSTVEINLIALMRLTYLALPYLLEQTPAHIVNIASIAGKFGSQGVAAYAASKHGVVGFSSALREELAPRGIGVSWLCPTPVRTRMTEGVSHTFLTPLINPERVARSMRRAIVRNQAEVFVPRYLRLTIDILPAMFPNFARWLSRKAKASEGWLIAEKPLPR